MKIRHLWLNLLAAAFAASLAACAAQVPGDESGSVDSAEVSGGGGPNQDTAARSAGSRENVRTTASALTDTVSEPHPDPMGGDTADFDPNEPHPDPMRNPNPGDHR